MKKTMAKNQAMERIIEFFKKENFTAKEMKKIKRLAMKHNLKLGKNRKRFCKKCYSKLKGKTRVGKNYKSVECRSCGYLNKWRLS